MEGLSACECPVCFQLLNHSTHEPMSMPCGHTLCKVCVQQLANRATNTVSRAGVAPRPTFQCPICRQWVNVDAVSLNVTLRDLLAELSKMEEKRTLPLGTALNVAYSEIGMEEVLDRGAFGEVSRGRWRGNEVAVKLFNTGRPTPETIEAFQREVFVMNCLRHPNVVLLLGACQTPPKLAIIMEYVAGGSLHQLIHIDKTPLQEVEIARLATDICRGLQYLHSINVLHRDLKSKNVLLTGHIPCQAKLCDFGLARMRQESATMTGNIGTVHWTAPEVLNNLRYQFPADVYGFGMVVYEMACGRVPLGHMVPMAVMLAVAVKKERPAIPDNAHPIFQQLIRDCSQWEPSQRPSLPSILVSLAELLPQSRAERQAEGEGGKRGRLEHQDSLGVIFLSATDSADLAQQESSLAELARMNQAPPTPQQATPTIQQAPHPHTVQLRKPSYEDLYFDEDMASQEIQQTAPPTFAGEMTSLHMAQATQMSHPLGQHPHQLPHRGSAYQHPHHGPPYQLPHHGPPYQLPHHGPPYQLPHQLPPRGPPYHPQPYQGPARPYHGPAPAYDTAVARDLQAQLNLAQMEADHQLAEQLQMKEHSFQLPTTSDHVAPPTSVFPPQPLLDTIKSKRFPELRHVEEATPIHTKAPPRYKKATPNKIEPMPEKATPTKGMLASLLAKAKPRSPTSTSKSTKKTKSLFSETTAHSSGKAGWSSSVDPPTKSAKKKSSKTSHYIKSWPMGKTKAPYTQPGPPPPTPPPPPPVPPRRLARNMPSQRQLMLREVQARAPTVARQLKPVETIVKRPFRVGHVVGGYDAERDQFTFQNLIASFNRQRLMPIVSPVPTPAYPVGRVVTSKHRVKRISSLLDPSLSPSNEVSPPPPLLPIPASPPRRRLHPTIQASVQRFSKSSLHHVETVVKQSLPNSRELEQERRSTVVQDIMSFDHTHLVPVQTVVKNTLPSARTIDMERRLNSDLAAARDLVMQSVVTFDPSTLHQVVTEEKNPLPSIDTIELEKSMLEQP